MAAIFDKVVKGTVQFQYGMVLLYLDGKQGITSILYDKHTVFTMEPQNIV